MITLPRRLQNLTNSLESLAVDAMLVTSGTNVRYLSGFSGDSSSLLVQPSSTTILSDGRYETQIGSECPALAVMIRPPTQSLADLTESVLNDAKVKRVGFEADHLSVTAFGTLAQRCKSVELVQTSGVVERLRMVKDEEEIATTRQAVRIAERAFESLRPMLTRDWTERSVAHELEAKMRFLGADRCSFAPIVAADEAGALPHYRPSGRIIGNAATLLIDWGAEYAGYASDLTRTLHQAHAGDAFRRAYEAVLEAQLAAIEQIRPGVVANQVDAISRNVLRRHGMDEAFKHGLGHGTGLEIHELPRLSSLSDEPLVAGMIVTVEPGVYFERDFGIRIEDDVLVTEEGCEVLSGLAKGLDDCRLML